MKPPADIVFFPAAADFRAWLSRHHATAREVWVGLHKVDSGRPSITWPESIDEALCYGWIDGIRHPVEEWSYVIRFTPRKPGSVWSAVNIRRVQALTERGLMHAAGLRAFAARRENRSGLYSYEQRTDQLPEPYSAAFRTHPAAWQFFQSQPPGYRKKFGWWVVSAKREETRRQRLGKLIEASEKGNRLE